MFSKRPTSNIDWPDLVFAAEAMQETFSDVRVVTLYSHCLNQAEENNIPLSNIEDCEHVEVFEQFIQVVIDEEFVDDETTARALDLLTHVESFDVGSRTDFGPKKCFTHSKLH